MKWFFIQSLIFKAIAIDMSFWVKQSSMYMRNPKGKSFRFLTLVVNGPTCIEIPTSCACPSST